MAFGFDGLVKVEGFLGVPAFCVGANSLMGRNIHVERDCAFVELPPLHVEVGDLNFHGGYFIVKRV